MAVREGPAGERVRQSAESGRMPVQVRVWAVMARAMSWGATARVRTGAPFSKAVSRMEAE